MPTHLVTACPNRGDRATAIPSVANHDWHFVQYDDGHIYLDLWGVETFPFRAWGTLPSPSLEAIDLGNSLQSRLGARARTDLSNALNIGALPDASLGELMAEWVLGEYADPAGITHVKPLRMRFKGGLNFNLMSSVGERHIVPYNTGHINFTRALEVRRLDYAAKKASGLHTLSNLQGTTGYDSLVLFGREPTSADLDLLLPSVDRSDGWRRPNTEHTESWPTNRTGALDGDLTWGGSDEGAFNVNGGTPGQAIRPNTGGSNSEARAESDVDGADHETEADIQATSTSGNSWAGVGARFQSGAQTCYASIAFMSANLFRVYEITAGGYTSLASKSYTFNASTFYNIICRCGEDASDEIKGLVDDTVEHDVTDTTLTSETRGGILSFKDGSGQMEWQNWAIRDLAAGTTHSASPIVVTLTPVAPRIQQTVRPNPIVITLTPVAPQVGQVVTASPIPITLKPVAPTFKQTTRPTPIPITLKPVAPRAQQTTRPSPIVITLTPVAPTVVQGTTFSASPIPITLTPVAPRFQQTTRPTPIVTTLTPVAPRIQQTTRVTPIVVTLTPVAPQVGVSFSASPIVVTLTPVAPRIQQTIRPTSIVITLTPVAPTVVAAGTFSASPVVVTLTPVAPRFQQTTRPTPIVVTLTPVSPSFNLVAPAAAPEAEAEGVGPGVVYWDVKTRRDRYVELAAILLPRWTFHVREHEVAGERLYVYGAAPTLSVVRDRVLHREEGLWDRVLEFKASEQYRSAGLFDLSPADRMILENIENLRDEVAERDAPVAVADPEASRRRALEILKTLGVL